MSIWDKLAATWPAQLGQTIAQALMAPGNAYRSTPDNPVTTEQLIVDIIKKYGLAGMLGGSALGLPPNPDNQVLGF